ncbi:MAG: DUF262 domain-containing protein [Paludibacteraceae bacterium]|nr:DUF262 domain-containing protein [Paludibacteraceae bacterium]
MSELVYSIKQIFNAGNKSALTDNKASFYYIAPYQRGYKWESNSSYAQVPQMLIDIYEAFVYGTTEYFLQYITVKKLKLDDNGDVLEVIDGQQRLTTLSLLLSRIVVRNSDLENISYKRLQYFRYDGDIFASLQIPDSEEEDENIIHQDRYYMVKAVRTIDKFLKLLEENDKLEAYYHYLLDSVKLIFNIEDENTNSEEVFENLNNNKVPLTNQYLIKGLLLTKAVNRTTSFNRTLSYKEILDQRTVMGRVWDEINAWISQPEIAHFFFATKKKENPNGIEKLLEVVLRRIENTQTDTGEIEDSLLQQYRLLFDPQSRNVQPSMYELFNKFNRIIRDEKTAFDVLNLIKHAYRALYNIWYGDIDFYNLFGYVRFAKSQQYNISWTDEVIWKDRAVVKKDLAKRVLKIIPDLKHSQTELRYDNNQNKLTNLLLSFNVFLEQEEKFDFYQYDSENWTLEHLSPQNPKGDIKIPHNLVTYVLGKLPESLEQSKRADLEAKLLNGEAISVDDLPFLYDSEIDEHVMGNMALLEGGDNSAVSNNPFIVKRNIIISRRNKGSFVPYHTIALYEKSLDMKEEKGFTPDLFRWDINDITVHEQWMRQRNKEIIEQLKKHLA